MFDDFPQITSEAECLSCRGCCYFQHPKSPWRPRVITPQAGISDAHIDDQQYLKAVTEEGCVKCVFLNRESHECRIYLTRPLECRIYPFLITRGKDGMGVSVHLSCPSVQARLNKDQLNSSIKQVREYFFQPVVKEFIRNNPLVVSDYSDYPKEIMFLFSLGL